VESDLLHDLRNLRGPGWIPPEPLLGIGVRLTLASMTRRVREEQ
jgi:hypothetical protein